MSGRRAPLDGSATARRLDRLASLLAVLTVVATLANGAGFFLRRIGLIDSDAYRRDLLRFCSQPIRELWLPASCHFRRVLAQHPLTVLRLETARLYGSEGPETALKLIKYGVVAGLIVVSIGLILSRRVPPPRWRLLGPALPLVVSIAISFTITAIRNGLPLALAAVLSATWVPLLVLGGWLTTPGRLQRLADAMAVLLVVQLPLALVEAMRGLPIPFGPLMATLHPPALPIPSRLALTLILPNSLGVFTVCALAFCLSFSRRRRWRPWLFLAALPPVLLARSGAGCIILLVLAALPGMEWLLQRHSPRRHGPGWVASAALLAAGLAAGLPRFLGRPDLLQSLSGRLGALPQLLDPRQPLQLLFGQGLGAAGNRLFTLLGQGPLLNPLVGNLWPDSIPVPGPGDSQLVLLLVQGGLLAAAAFYGLLIHALIRDRAARPFLISVLLGSLILNISELFPIELLLPVALGHSLGTPRLSRPAAPPPAPSGPRPTAAPPARSPGG